MSRTDEWKTSSSCSDSSCLEVLREDDAVHLRMKQDPDTVITMTTREWEAFAKGVVKGEF